MKDNFSKNERESQFWLTRSSSRVQTEKPFLRRNGFVEHYVVRKRTMPLVGIWDASKTKSFRFESSPRGLFNANFILHYCT